MLIIFCLGMNKIINNQIKLFFSIMLISRTNLMQFLIFNCNKMSDIDPHQNINSYDEALILGIQQQQLSLNILDHMCNEPDPYLKEQCLDSHIQYPSRSQEHDVNTSNKREGKSRDRKKVFYRDKLASLLKPGETIKQEYNYIPYGQSDPSKMPISKAQQLKRNRESAKNSRERKKEYLTVLENKIEQQEQIISDLKNQLENITLQRDRLKESNPHQVRNFIKSKGEAYQQLQALVNNPQSNEQTIKAQVQFMFEKFSASGSQRVSLMNYYMNEISQQLISDIHKYFLTSGIFRNEFTCSILPKPIDLDVIKILNLDFTSLASLIRKYKNRFIKETSVFKTLTQQFYRVFKSIQNQTRVMQAIFNDLIKEINIKNIGKLIIWFQDNQFCREVRRVRKQWMDLLKTGQQQIEFLRKQTKQN